MILLSKPSRTLLKPGMRIHSSLLSHFDVSINGSTKMILTATRLRLEKMD